MYSRNKAKCNINMICFPDPIFSIGLSKMMHRWMQWWIFTWIRFVCQSVSKLEYSFPADYVDRLWTKKPNCSCHVSSIVFKAVKDTVWNSGRDHFPGSVMTFIPPVWIRIHHHVPKNIQVPFCQFNDTSPFPVFSVIFKSRTRVSRSESTRISGILNKTFWISVTRMLRIISATMTIMIFPDRIKRQNGNWKRSLLVRMRQFAAVPIMTQQLPNTCARKLRHVRFPECGAWLSKLDSSNRNFGYQNKLSGQKKMPCEQTNQPVCQ